MASGVPQSPAELSSSGQRATANRREIQLATRGVSLDEIIGAALVASRPQPGLSWLDIGCGTGAALRRAHERHAPSGLVGIDIVNWLDPDLRNLVTFREAAAEDGINAEPADRILALEVLEHLEAPLVTLRDVAKLLRPGGRLVATVPNFASLNSMVHLALRGELAAFRAWRADHLSPVVPHVVERILREEGLTVEPRFFAAGDYLPLRSGRRWPESLRRALPRWLSMSVGFVAVRN